MAEIMKTFAYRQGGFIFHCRSGKDRTGLVAAMLLSIAGVPKDTICADFGLSSEYLNEPELTGEELKKPGAYQKGSEPETMKLTLAFLDRSYGGAINYLEAQGVSSTEIELIRNKIIDDWSVHFSYDLDLKNESICLSSGNGLGSYKNVVEGPISSISGCSLSKASTN